MGLKASGGSGSGGFGNQRTVDIINGISTNISTNFTSGGVPAVSLLGISPKAGGLRFGAGEAFPLGANGPDGIANNDAIGRAAVFFSPAAFLRDQYCGQTMAIRLLRPTFAFVDPFQVWEFEADLCFRLPAGVPGGDFGIVLHGDTALTGWGTDFTNVGVAGIGKFGMALMVTAATNELRCIARSAINGGFTVNVATGIIAQPPGGFANDRFRRCKFRLESATVNADAQCSWFIDGQRQLTLPFTAAAGMPNVALLTAGVQWLSAFRGFIRNANNNVSGAVLQYGYWRVSAAPSVAAMESPG
jgi:hypothetical protein